MDFSIRERIAQPLDLVWDTYRDRLPDLIPYLPNVTSVAVIERSGDNDNLDLVNEWSVAGAVPGVVRRIIKDDMLRYKDYASWHRPELKCHWRNEFPALPSGLECSGTNFYREVGGGCEIEITGRLVVDLAKVPGVPRLMRRLSGTVESFVIGRIKPNLIEVCRAVEKLLAAENR